ncbi:MAG: hypothetical protein H6718_09830 [Polyangiaceae bacterium]|nr:hypothetical protein [Polyangiaceae bacterium]MCB9607383.1 hypothetical protein [Polyangiaceae bacterium]
MKQIVGLAVLGVMAVGGFAACEGVSLQGSYAEEDERGAGGSFSEGGVAVVASGGSQTVDVTSPSDYEGEAQEGDGRTSSFGDDRGSPAWSNSQTFLPDDEPLPHVSGTKVPESIPKPSGAYYVTRQPTFRFDTNGTLWSGLNSGPDPSVAVSRTHVCITARMRIACYEKSGKPVDLGGSTNSGQNSIYSWFVTDGHISFTQAWDPVKDARMVFSEKYGRFIMYAQTKEYPPRMMLAVSRSEDPRDGWNHIIFRAASTADGQDWDGLGINGDHLLILNLEEEWTHENCSDSDCPDKCKVRRLKQTGSAKDSQKWCVESRNRHYRVDLSRLVFSPTTIANPVDPVEASSPPDPYYVQSWTAQNSSGGSYQFMPCTDYDDSADSYWVAKENGSQLRVRRWTRGGGLSSFLVNVAPEGSGSFPNDTVTTQRGGSIGFDNMANQVMGAVCRGGRMVVTQMVRKLWSSSDRLRVAPRLAEIQLSPWGVATPTKDKILGRNSQGESLYYDYGWPGVSIGSDGDIVLGTVRTASTEFPDLRANVWLSGQTDVGTDTTLLDSHTQRATLVNVGYQDGLPRPAQYHMAGAAADPSTTAVYLTQITSDALISTTGWKLEVSKMGGQTLPDLVTTSITINPSGKYVFTVRNQGDAEAPALYHLVRMSSDPLVTSSDAVVGAIITPALLPGEEAQIEATFSLSASPGTYWIGPTLSQVVAEHSHTNNSNPFLGGDRGNLKVTVQ